METKAEIRKRILHVRASLTEEEQETYSHRIMNQVLTRPQFQQAEWIYLYMDYKSEVRTEELIEACLKFGKRIAVPKVDGLDMDFYEITGRTDVREGYKGILEPVSTCKVQNKHAFMVVPGVAFSEDRVRIGYGKGYYDRYLKRFPDIYTCAIAYECQVLKELPREEHDMPVKELITEGVIRC